jgi:hypothetical protein
MRLRIYIVVLKPKEVFSMRTTALLMLLLLIMAPAMSQADVPGLISYQGMLTDDDGVALDTTVSMTFTIYIDSTGPNFVWNETQPSVVVDQGFFNVLLGRVSPIPETVFDAASRWLRVRVGSDPALQPRQRMTSVGYSFRAAEADTADYARSATAASDGDWTISGPNMYSAVAGNVGIGTVAPEEELHINYGNVQISGDDDYNMSLIFDDEDTGNEFSIVGHQHLKLNTNGTPRLAISTAGDVGIGTTLPLARLHVLGSGGNYGYMGHSGYGVYGYSGGSYGVYGNSSSGFGVHGYSGGSYGTGGSHSSGNAGYLGTNTYGAAGSHSGGNYGRLGTSNEGVYGNSSGGWGVHGYSSTACGVYGSHSSGNCGYIGTSSYGVYGGSSSGRGVWGNSTSGYGVYGSHGGGNYGYLGSGSYGVYGGSSGGRGMYGASTSNYGVYGSSSTSNGVHGYSSSGYGVYGSHSGGNYGYLGGDDYGVWGEDAVSGNIGVLGTGGYAVYGQYGGTLNSGGLGGSDKGVYGTCSSTGYGVYGISGDGYGVYGISGGGYGVYGKSESPSTGTIATYGYHDDDADGTDYHYSSTMCGVVGHAEYGNDYHCGVQGLTYSGDPGNRASGVHGRFDDLYTIWGSLAYKSSTDNYYGGYFTSYTAGAGKSFSGNEAQMAVGLGSWGDLFGADIHGKVYGIYAEGGNYSLYSHGTVFKDELDVHLQHMSDRSTSVLYTNVSTDVTVQTSGFSALSKGTCRIEFDDDFKKVVSPDVPVIVTVTPTGNSNGVYVSRVTKDGFTVMENNSGKSSVTVTFIAIGRRAGYEDPKLPAEVVSSDYVDKLSRGLHNDADIEMDGEGLYYQDGQLYVGKHPSVLPDLNRRREESEEMKERRREMLEAQEQDRLERERMEQEVSRLEEERLQMLELQQEESLERARMEEEARRIEEEQRKRAETDTKPRLVN